MDDARRTLLRRGAAAAGVLALAVVAPQQTLVAAVGLPAVGVLAGAGSAVAARAAGLTLDTVDVGVGRALLVRDKGVLRTVLRAWPTGVSWIGYAVGERAVRARFAAAHVAGLVVTVAAAVAAGVLGWWLLASAVALLLLLDALLPGRLTPPGYPSGLSQLRRLPEARHLPLVGWSRSVLAQQGYAAHFADDPAGAEAFARQALQADDEDWPAWRVLYLACDARGRTAEALDVAGRLVRAHAAAGTDTSRYGMLAGVDLANHAWALLRAVEDDVGPADWRSRAEEELLATIELLAPIWETEHMWALMHVLDGRPQAALECLRIPLQEATKPLERSDVLLTAALVQDALGDRAAARAHLEEAVTLGPHPRADAVRRRVGAAS